MTSIPHMSLVGVNFETKFNNMIDNYSMRSISRLTEIVKINHTVYM